jgi:hypothetical protein
MKIVGILNTLTIFFAFSLNAGVVILTEVPEITKQLLAKAQAIVKEHLEQINKQSADQKYLFECCTYSPHMTLAYISEKEFSLSQLEQAEPKLVENLGKLANRSAITIADAFKEPELVVWDGKRESTFEENAYKNYAILVIKMKTSAELTHLVADIDIVLEKYPTASKREFPFNPFVTIGWLYDQKDMDPTPIIKAVQPALEKLVSEFKTDQSFIIDSFKLSAHDKKQIHFSFKK